MHDFVKDKPGVKANVCLRSLKKTDKERLAYLANNKNVSENLRDAFPNPYTIKDAEAFIQKSIRNKPETVFAIEYKGEYVGNIGYVPLEDVYRRSAEIGYFIGEDFWGRGIASQALSLLEKHIFDNFDIVRLHAGIFEFNKASIRVLENCGFQLEGISKRAICKKNRLWDEYRYAKLKE